MIISIMRPEFNQLVTLYKPKNKLFLHQEHTADVVSLFLLVAKLLLIEKLVVSDVTVSANIVTHDSQASR